MPGRSARPRSWPPSTAATRRRCGSTRGSGSARSGRMPRIGTKFGRRLDLVLLQRSTQTTRQPRAAAGRSVLDDLFVLDLTVARAGPTAVRNLADWGARVLRIEPRDPGLALLTDHDNSDYLNLHRRTQLIAARPSRRRRPGDVLRPRAPRRRARRELPGAGQGHPRHRLRSVRERQPAPRLRQHRRLRPGRSGSEQRAVDQIIQGSRRADERHRAAGARARSAPALRCPTRRPATC